MKDILTIAFLIVGLVIVASLFSFFRTYTEKRHGKSVANKFVPLLQAGSTPLDLLCNCIDTDIDWDTIRFVAERFTDRPKEVARRIAKGEEYSEIVLSVAEDSGIEVSKIVIAYRATLDIITPIADSIKVAQSQVEISLQDLPSFSQIRGVRVIDGDSTWSCPISVNQIICAYDDQLVTSISELYTVAGACSKKKARVAVIFPIKTHGSTIEAMAGVGSDQSWGSALLEVKGGIHPIMAYKLEQT